MTPQQLFEANLGTIERVIGVVCRRARLFGPEAEDFASEVKLALIDNDYEILGKYEGRSSLDTFLTVVIQRLLADARTRTKGRWHPSSEAQRLGPIAVQVETLMRRDGQSLDEALPRLRALDPAVTRDDIAALLKRLPERTSRPRRVDFDAIGYAIAGHDSADARAMSGDRQRLSSIAGSKLREQLDTLPTEDRLLIRLRFASDLTIADISRMMQVPQRPLYRRLDALLNRLRGVLVDAGIDRATASDLVGRENGKIDLGLNGKSDDSSQSIAGEEP